MFLKQITGSELLFESMVFFSGSSSIDFFQGNDIRLLHFLEEDESLENEYDSASSDTG